MCSVPVCFRGDVQQSTYLALMGRPIPLVAITALYPHHGTCIPRPLLFPRMEDYVHNMRFSVTTRLIVILPGRDKRCEERVGCVEACIPYMTGSRF